MERYETIRRPASDGNGEIVSVTDILDDVGIGHEHVQNLPLPTLENFLPIIRDFRVYRAAKRIRAEDKEHHQKAA